jgi:RNA polymerase sigma-70 factor (ECF subfamily)
VVSDDPAVRARTFELAVMPLAGKLRTRAREFTRGGPDAEDLVQETLLRAWKMWGRQPIGDVWGWLWLILRNAWFNMVRDANSHRAIHEKHAAEIADVRGAPPSAPDAAVTGGLDDKLHTAVRSLPATQRAVIEMDLLGADDVTTSRHLRITRQTVRNAKVKARARIRAMI